MNGFTRIQDIPLAPGVVRLLSCKICGALVGISLNDTSDYAEIHRQYHLEKGDIK